MPSPNLSPRPAGRDVVLCVAKGRRELTNAAFLLGAFMLLALGDDPARIWREVRAPAAARELKGQEPQDACLHWHMMYKQIREIYVHTLHTYIYRSTQAPALRRSSRVRIRKGSI